jgi:glycine cleavage system H protein
MDDACNQHNLPSNWEVRGDRAYDDHNFWIKVQGREITIGFTDYGQWSIGDILYLELVGKGSLIRKGEKFGSVESGKWVGSLISPVTGVVLEDNLAIMTDPRTVNLDPYGSGWMVRMELKTEGELDFLMGPKYYADWVSEQLRKEGMS